MADKKSHIEMKDENFPEGENRLADSEMAPGIYMLSRDSEEEINIWLNEEGDTRLISVGLGRIVVSMSESEFFMFAKHIQNSVKKLLGIE
jgi:hypothetical protein